MNFYSRTQILNMSAEELSDVAIYLLEEKDNLPPIKQKPGRDHDPRILSEDPFLFERIYIEVALSDINERLREGYD